ncbi:MAG TPA: ABC transporter permease [Pyrinomonadaceae bacterium]|jgi:putative ABC transport system permease protein|nr:ABC transporter permease [Pyrinomonadaceae bacterium]
MITILQDLRYGTRMLLKTPAITFIVMLALALGIGANSAIFSVLNAVVLRPLPYDHPNELLFLNERSPVLDEMSISYPNFTDWRNQNHVFEKIGVYNRNSYNLTGYGEAERSLTAQCSADLFAALRANALVGRVFTNDEDQPGASPVVVLSYALWQRRFGGQNSILNQPITLNGKSYTVIGVMPPDYAFPSRVDMWVPVGPLSADSSWKERGNHPGLYAVARLKPGMTQAQAQADMNLIAANLNKQYPDTNGQDGIRIRTLTEILVGQTVRDTLWILFGAVAFVLLIACANIANLLLARATSRRKEMAIRAAMGAGRWRIARQLLTESLLLAIIGGGLGLAIAQLAIKFILYLSPTAIPRSREITVDWRVLAFTLGVSLLTGILFGLVPALQAGEVDVNETLKEAGRGTSARHWLRSSLVIVEVATTMVLLIGAGLMIRSFYRLENVNPGFSYQNLTSFTVSLPQKKYATEVERSAFFNNLLQNLRTLPGVQSVGAASGLPLGNNGWQTSFMIDGRPKPPPGDEPLMEACTVTPDYFRAMNIPLLRGRYYNDHDDRSFIAGKDLSKLDEGERLQAGVNVIIIDEQFAKRYWPNEDAVGKRIRFGFDEKAPVLEVVGVVGRVKMEGLDTDSNRVQGYFSFSQVPFGGMTVIVKAQGDPNQLIASARNQVRTLDPDQPIYNIRTMDEIRGESVAPQRLNLVLLSIFAGIAFVLAVVGVYGVMSYAVTQRTHEIGIRMAIGAQPRDVFRMILTHGMSLTLIGIAAGLLGAFGLTRLMATMLFGVKPTDPLTFAGVAVLLTAVALFACYIPGRRATKVDPVKSLRYE